jgi:hypothetical protein
LIAFFRLMLTPSTGEAIATAAITASAIVTVLHFGLRFMYVSSSPPMSRWCGWFRSR